MSKKSKNEPRSTFNLEHSYFPFLSIPVTYKIFLKDTQDKWEKCFESENILEALDYAYGIDDFIIESDKGLHLEFHASEYTKKQCHNAGFIEPFDFIIHNLLTSLEIDYWKMKIRCEDMY